MDIGRFGKCLVSWSLQVYFVVYSIALLRPVVWIWAYTQLWDFAAPMENPSSSGVPTCKMRTIGDYGNGSLYTGVYHVPKRGCVERVCGLLLHRDSSKIAFVTRQGKLLKHADQLNDACESIWLEDVVRTSTGNECHRWCQEVMGEAAAEWKFTPMCSGPLTNTSSGPGRMWQACGKAVAEMRSRVCHWSLKYIASALYGMPGLVVAYQKSSQPAWRGLQKVLTGHLHESGFRTPGPFAAFYFAPIRLLTNGDAGAYRLVFTAKAFLTLIEAPLDLFSAWSLFEDGEPLYALVTVIGFASVLDPLQLRGYMATAESWRDGYETFEYLQHKMDEGFREAPLGGTIGLISLFTTPLLHIGVVLLRALNFLITFFVTLPDAFKAKAVIDAHDAQQLDITNAYAVHAKKAEVETYAMLNCVLMIPGVLGFLVIRQYKYDMDIWNYFLMVNSCMAMCLLEPLKRSLSLASDTFFFIRLSCCPSWGLQYLSVFVASTNAILLIYRFGSVVNHVGLEPLAHLLDRLKLAGMAVFGAIFSFGAIILVCWFVAPEPRPMSSNEVGSLEAEKPSGME